jgi:hypothetical protein
MSRKVEKHKRKPDVPANWKLNDLARECVAWYVDKYIKFKPDEKLVKVDSNGAPIDPELLPINVASKGHWSSAEAAIQESFGMYIDRDSLKAYGSELLKLRAKFKALVNELDQPNPWPNTLTPERQTETRKKLAAEFSSLRAPTSSELALEEDDGEGKETPGKKRKRDESSGSLQSPLSRTTSASSGLTRTSSVRSSTPSPLDSADSERMSMSLTYHRQMVELLGKILAILTEEHNAAKKRRAKKLGKALGALAGQKVEKPKKEKKEDKKKDSKDPKDEADGLAGEVASVDAKGAKGKRKKGKGKGKKEESSDEDSHDQSDSEEY